MPTPDLLTMSRKELDRAEWMQRVHEQRMTQADAAERLGLSVRQVERLYRAYKAGGAAALASKKRGRPSSRRLPDALRAETVGLVREKYGDFGPTLACEKLVEVHGIDVSVETLRQWMIGDGVWLPRNRRLPRAHQPRSRRPCLGELVQIDGCNHEWFEDRGPRCVLLVYVDDATSRLMKLLFVRSESAFDYFAATRSYLEEHGRPLAFYSDKHSVFRVTAKEPHGGDGGTKFSRAMSELNVDILCANSPQAKGRVERAHQTLQDRLVKELRLRGISSIEAGNAFLPEFAADYDTRFARSPANLHDAHRALRPDDDLEEIFRWKEQRKLTANLTIHYRRSLYLVEDTLVARAAAGKLVDVLEREDGTVILRHGDDELEATAVRKEGHVSQQDVESNKYLGRILEQVRHDQLARDEETLRTGKATLRQKHRLRLDMLRRIGTPAEGDSPPPARAALGR
jgi:transposase